MKTKQLRSLRVVDRGPTLRVAGMSKYVDAACLSYQVLSRPREVLHKYTMHQMSNPWHDGRRSMYSNPALPHDVTALWRRTMDGEYEYMPIRPLIGRVMPGQTKRNQMAFTIGMSYKRTGVAFDIDSKPVNDETFMLTEGPYAYYQRQVSFRTQAHQSVGNRICSAFIGCNATNIMLHVLCKAGMSGRYSVHSTDAANDCDVLMMTDATLHFFTARTPVSSCSDFIEFAEACAQDDTKTLYKNYTEVFEMKVDAVIKEHPEMIVNFPVMGGTRARCSVPTFIACMQPKAEHILPAPLDSTTVHELRHIQTKMFDELYALQTDNMCLDPVNSETEFMSDILQEKEIDWQQFFD